MKYFIYARKSADSEERQVLSIESQLQELRDFGNRENLELVVEFTESKTAKEPGREVFNLILSHLKKNIEVIVISDKFFPGTTGALRILLDRPGPLVSPPLKIRLEHAPDMDPTAISDNHVTRDASPVNLQFAIA